MKYVANDRNVEKLRNMLQTYICRSDKLINIDYDKYEKLKKLLTYIIKDDKIRKSFRCDGVNGL